MTYAVIDNDDPNDPALTKLVAPKQPNHGPTCDCHVCWLRGTGTMREPEEHP